MAERQRIARDLHDTISQHLFSVTLHGRTAQLAAATGGTEAAELLRHNLSAVIDLSEHALADMRDFVFQLHPAPLAEHGLAHVLGQHAAAVAGREQLTVTVDVDEEETAHLDLADAEDAYRIVVEALTNVVKHAAARICRISVRRSTAADGALVLEVADDGVGLPEARAGRETFGLLSMRERTERLGGRLDVARGPDGGTVVRAVVPHRSRGRLEDPWPGTHADRNEELPR
jgi:signal transduction histidine kinase